ncbi:hypothetical protein CIPAW_02G047200 [Carya illinoinensis]|uniref:No apical meristem-associated C-terminal domain-containing protein n=1 Tax=Carya illinoinensis TaxID=32201 RepID=A0A8T1R9K6_CARIL|nr:hypothetical protein CIPAW_02G047200 [Carya illinoinensis]
MVHDKIVLSPKQIIAHALSMQKYFQEQLHTPHSKLKSYCSWQPPPFGFVKLNIYGAMFSNQQRAGVGVILRDQKCESLPSSSTSLIDSITDHLLSFASSFALTAKIEKAKELYQSNQSATFNFLYCWTILTHHPKWKQTEGNVKTRRRSITPNAHVPKFTILDEDTISLSIDVNLERPIGKKAEKKQKRQDSTSSNIADLVTKMREKSKRSNAEKVEDRKEIIHLTKERLDLDQ